MNEHEAAAARAAPCRTRGLTATVLLAAADDRIAQHHQGGLTGYASCELIATPRTGQAIQPGQAFAWNPSVAGAKAEETFVLTESGPEGVAGATAAVV